MTPSERKALLFLTLVALLGATVRAVRAMRESAPPPAAARAALARQIQAVDSAGAASRKKGAAPKGAASGNRGGRPRQGIAAERPPLDPRPGVLVIRGRRDTAGTGPGPFHPLDMDVASAAEIERLPRVGPVLARRIVADRDTFGPFGSIDNLRRVKGVGPAMAKRLEPLVTFSLTPRPSNAVFGRVKRPPPSPDTAARRRPHRRPPA